MSKTLISRVQSLAEAKATKALSRAASLVRKAASEDASVEKMSGILAHLKTFPESVQEKLVALCEELNAIPDPVKAPKESGS